MRGGARGALMTSEGGMVPRIDSDHLSQAFQASLSSHASEFLLDTQQLTVDDVNRLRSAPPCAAPRALQRVLAGCFGRCGACVRQAGLQNAPVRCSWRGGGRRARISQSPGRRAGRGQPERGRAVAGRRVGGELARSLL